MSVSLADEVQSTTFGDKRLDKRLGKVLEELGAKPHLSIPAATHACAEMEGAYRFFDNDKVSPEKILQSHIEATRERISQSDLVLLVQDTTELDFSRPTQQVQGAGPMDAGPRRGAFFHPLLAFDVAGLPLGTVWQKNWARDEVQETLTKAEKDRKKKHTPIDGLESVKTIVQSYCIRWQIEIYFRTIKSGCRIEQRQFETLKRLMNCVAVYSIIAWRIMYLCRLGRECPDLDCEVVFESSEWKSVYAIVKKKDPPLDPPRLNEMIRMIASLGGYVLRKSTEPGPQTLWVGLQRVHDLSTAWEAFGPQNNVFFDQHLCGTMSGLRRGLNLELLKVVFQLAGY